MRLQARNFAPIVKRVGIHTLELNLDGMRYRLTESEAQTLAQQLLSLTETE
ncbi:hypothetical protein [Rhodococcus wratislaviensis]|uniref:hypothetical protein n=1 Tax=Rhodococcus wratislaviensis TaxID=44752 RepID=UPI0036507219